MFRISISVRPEGLDITMTPESVHTSSAPKESSSEKVPIREEAPVPKSFSLPPEEGNVSSASKSQTHQFTYYMPGGQSGFAVQTEETLREEQKETEVPITHGRLGSGKGGKALLSELTEVRKAHLAWRAAREAKPVGSPPPIVRTEKVPPYVRHWVESAVRVTDKGTPETAKCPVSHPDDFEADFAELST